MRFCEEHWLPLHRQLRQADTCIVMFEWPSWAGYARGALEGLLNRTR